MTRFVVGQRGSLQTEAPILALGLITVLVCFTETVEIILQCLPLPIEGSQTVLETGFTQASTRDGVRVLVRCFPASFASNADIESHLSTTF